MAVPDQRAQVVKVDLDQTRTREQLPDAAQTLHQQAARLSEHIEQTGVLVNQLEHLLARQADHPVGHGFDLLETQLGLLVAAVAFTQERQGDKRQHQRAGFPGGPRQHGTDAAARPAPQTGDNQHHIGAAASRLEG